MQLEPIPRHRALVPLPIAREAPPALAAIADYLHSIPSGRPLVGLAAREETVMFGRVVISCQRIDAAVEEMISAIVQAT